MAMKTRVASTTDYIALAKVMGISLRAPKVPTRKGQILVAAWQCRPLERVRIPPW